MSATLISAVSIISSTSFARHIVKVAKLEACRVQSCRSFRSAGHSFSMLFLPPFNSDKGSKDWFSPVACVPVVLIVSSEQWTEGFLIVYSDDIYEWWYLNETFKYLLYKMEPKVRNWADRLLIENLRRIRHFRKECPTVYWTEVVIRSVPKILCFPRWYIIWTSMSTLILSGIL